MNDIINIILHLVALVVTGSFLFILIKNFRQAKDSFSLIQFNGFVLVWLLSQTIFLLILPIPAVRLIYWRFDFALTIVVIIFLCRFIVSQFHLKLNQYLVTAVLSLMILAGLITLFTPFVLVPPSSDATGLDFSLGPLFLFYLNAGSIPLVLIFIYALIKHFINRDKTVLVQHRLILAGLVFPTILGPILSLAFTFYSFPSYYLISLTSVPMVFFFVLAIYFGQAFGISVEFFRIRTKITLVAIFIVTSIISVTYIINDYYFRQTLYRDVSKNLQSTADIQEARLTSIIENDILEVRTLANRTGLVENLVSYLQKPTPKLSSEIIARLEDARKSDELIKNIILVDPDTYIIKFSLDPQFINSPLPSNFSSLKVTLAGSEIHLNQPPYLSSLAAYAPIIDHDKVIMIAVVIKADQKIIEVVDDHRNTGETGEMVVAQIDPSGKAMFLQPPRFYAGDNSIDMTQDHRSIVRALKHQESYFSDALDYRGFHTVAVTRFMELTGWGISVKIDRTEVEAPLSQMRQTVAPIFLGIYFLAIIVALAISHSIASPIEKLRRAVDSVRQGNFEIKNTVESRDEIGILSLAFNDMIKSVVDSRANIEQKVRQQTQEISSKSRLLQDQQLALSNLLEDVQSEKILSEQRLQDLQKFQLAVENASDQIVISDSEGIVVYANPILKQITGYSPSQALGKKAGKLWGGHMPKEFYQNMWKTIKTDKKVFHGELQNIRKNGEKYTAEISVSPIVAKDGQVLFFVAIERDVTHEKAVDQMKTEFVSFASHQLRTPLSAMKWFSEMLLSGDAGKLTKEQKEYVQNIYDSNERMVSLVKDLLDISRIESGRIIIEPRPTDISQLLNEIIKEVADKAKAKKQQLIVSVNPKLPLVNLDPTLIRNAILNLITNAIKYTPEKGEINIFISRKGEDILCQVTDNGLGIPKNQQAQVYDKFFRASNAIKTETEGSGLGLYLVKAVIESSGGKIWFKSTEGKGTTFTFSIPLKGVPPKKGVVRLGS